MSDCENCKYERLDGDCVLMDRCPKKDAVAKTAQPVPQWALDLADTVARPRAITDANRIYIAEILVKTKDEGFLAGYKEGRQDALMVLTGEVENLMHAFKVRTGAK